ncbi:MAG: glycoside hydrolase family 3 N-terminal domain-containing protein [Bacteroidales bacterium]
MFSLYRFLFPVTFILLILPVNHSPVSEVSAQSQRVVMPPFAGETSHWVDSVLLSLTPEERIAQLIMVDASSDNRFARDEYVSGLIRDYNIGGLVFMRGGAARQANMTNRYQAIAKTPLMVAMDAEWGLGMRLDSTMIYPRHLMLGAVSDNRLVYNMAAGMAEQMKRLGVHINFAPVADINVNPRNPVIGNRSFGDDKWNVASKALQYMKGMQDNGILAVGKHFPGHGDTDQDSHYTLPFIGKTREEFDTLELVPFRELIDNGIGGIMTAHLHVPSIDSTAELATSLSARAVEGLLRDQLGFSGLVFTDGLNMKGVSDHLPPGRLEVQALLAGNDVLLFPPDVGKAVSGIMQALQDGILTQEMIDEKCRRVLTAKYWFGLENMTGTKAQGLYSDLNKPEYELSRRKVIAASLTLLKNHNGLIPLKGLDTLNIATVSVGRGNKTVFQETLELYAPVKHFTIDKYSTLEQFNGVINDLDRFNLVIVGIHDADGRRSRQYGISPQTSYFVRKLAVRNNVIMAVFTSPYGLGFFDDLSGIRALLMAYDDNHTAQDISAQLIFGAAGAEGSLPVTATSAYRAGSGHHTEGGMRLRYSVPEEAGMDSGMLQSIDSLVRNAISEKATPGAQVLVARKGIVVYHKAFGYHTYRQERPVRTGDLYDLASITKIASSVPVIMKLTEDQRVDLGHTLGHYLPCLEGTNKHGLVIKDVLTHQARLQPWIPFYYDTFESLVPDEELFSRRVSVHYPYMLAGNMFMNRNYRFVDSLFTDQPDGKYTIRVANRMFMNRSYRDSIYRRIDESALTRRNLYLYSDLGYYYLKSIIETVSGEPLELYTEKNFYRPLGAGRMTYLPLEKFRESEIVPTENDIIFRRQLVHGHVHDPGTAMIGGVGGHAGLFSNANDLAKLMQLYLQDGDYGGNKFFAPETIERFTSAPNSHNGNRRGIGFDKPEKKFSRNGPAARSASKESFGHSGFTGTIAWADPVEEIVYIFLSNRVHPDQFNNKLLQMNLRTKIQQVIYDSIADQ